MEAKVTPRRPQGTKDDLSGEEREVLAEVLAAMRAIRHGHIQLTVQDARVVQIDKTEKHRLV